MTQTICGTSNRRRVPILDEEGRRLVLVYSGKKIAIVRRRTGVGSLFLGDLDPSTGIVTRLESISEAAADRIMTESAEADE